MAQKARLDELCVNCGCEVYWSDEGRELDHAMGPADSLECECGCKEPKAIEYIKW